MGRAIARLRVAETKLAEAAHQATGTDFKVSVRVVCCVCVCVSVCV